MQIRVLFLAAIWILAANGAGHSLAAERPNIVLIMVDDFGYECVTANGGQSYSTPHLDALAASGMRFTNCHVQPLCTPTRVQLMTGLYNVRNYIRFGLLPRDAKTFAHLLKDAGYATGICGKWQLGGEPDSPQHFGFDEAFLWQHTRRPPRYANPGLERDSAEEDYHQGEYGPQLINDFAVDFIHRHRDEPFFLYYPMILTHDPFQPTPDSPDWDPTAIGEKVHQDDKHFADMTAYMDKLVGRVVDTLESEGVRDNTLLIFLGDNGTHRSIVSRWMGEPYQGGKGTTTRAGTWVPLIVSWPAVIEQPFVSEALVSSVDFLPTLCEVSGATPPAACDGVSLTKLFRGQEGQVRESIYCWYSPRQGKNLNVSEFAFDERFKLYRSGEFFDYRANPSEEASVEPSVSAEADKARQKLQGVLDRYADARPEELDELAGKARARK